MMLSRLYQQLATSRAFPMQHRTHSCSSGLSEGPSRMQTIPSMSSTSTVRAACAAIRGSAAAAASATADDHATKRRRRRASAVTNEPIGTSNTAADAIAISQETNMALQSTAREQTRNSGSSNIVGRAEALATKKLTTAIAAAMQQAVLLANSSSSTSTGSSEIQQQRPRDKALQELLQQLWCVQKPHLANCSNTTLASMVASLSAAPATVKDKLWLIVKKHLVTAILQKKDRHQAAACAIVLYSVASHCIPANQSTQLPAYAADRMQQPQRYHKLDKQQEKQLIATLMAKSKFRRLPIAQLCQLAYSAARLWRTLPVQPLQQIVDKVLYDISSGSQLELEAEIVAKLLWGLAYMDFGVTVEDGWDDGDNMEYMHGDDYDSDYDSEDEYEAQIEQDYCKEESGQWKDGPEEGEEEEAWGDAALPEDVPGGPLAFKRPYGNAVSVQQLQQLLDAFMPSCSEVPVDILIDVLWAISWCHSVYRSRWWTDTTHQQLQKVATVLTDQMHTASLENLDFAAAALARLGCPSDDDPVLTQCYNKCRLLMDRKYVAAGLF